MKVKVPFWHTWSPMRRGSMTGAAAVVFVGLCSWSILGAIAERPSAELLRAMAAIGATLLIAYAIETSAVIRLDSARTPMRENWVGLIVGIGLTGLIAIMVSLGLGERAEVRHWLWADQAAFAFATSALLMLGLVVALLPALYYEWLRPAPPSDD